MELRQLRYFIAIAEAGKFSLAAKQVFVAQPALSASIKKLEEEIGVTLLNREGHGVSLTEEGEAFLIEAQKTLQQAQKAINVARQVAEAQLVFRIGFVPVAEIEIFPVVLPELRSKFPDIHLDFKAITNKEQIELLRNNKVDVIFSRNAINDEGLVSQLIYTEALQLIIPKKHPLSKLDMVPVNALNGVDFIMSDPDASTELNRLAKTFLHRHKITLRDIYYSHNILFNINSVALGLGLSIVPQYVDNLLSDKVVVRPLDKPLPNIGLYMVYSKNNPSKFLNHFVHTVEHYFVNTTTNGFSHE